MLLYIEVNKGQSDNDLHVQLGTYPPEIEYKASDVYIAIQAALNGIKIDMDKALADKGQEFLDNCTLIELANHVAQIS